MTEQPLDLKTALQGLWRRRLLIIILTLLGLGASLAYAVAQPRTERAAALVLLPPSNVTDTGVPLRDMRTQVVVATSDPVLSPAGRAVRPALSAAQLARELVAKTLSPQVLQIQVSNRRASDAVALANAVAGEYVRYVNSVLSGGGGAPAQVLQPSSSTTRNSPNIVILSGLGVGAGLFLGVVLALALTGRDRRLRTRDEIARAIGVAVLASVDATECRSVRHWRKLLDDRVPSASVSWNTRRALHRLATGDGQGSQEVRVIAFADDRPALAAAVQLAAVAAALGIPTALVPGDEAVWVPLRAACAVHERTGRRTQLITAVSSSHPSDPSTGSSNEALARNGGSTDVLGRAELSVWLLAVDRSAPEVRPFGGANLLTVSAGAATADDLARLALAAAESAQAIDGIVVVNPDVLDATTGSSADPQSRSILAGQRPTSPGHAVGGPR